jgi:uncharacterized oxidoreductase
MKTTNNTVLITGGSAGIGFEIAQQLIANGNQVIITGRNADRLQQAAAKLPGVITYVSDVSSASDVDQLVHELNTKYPTLNIVINNAAAVTSPKELIPGNAVHESFAEEIITNYLSVVRLNEKLLPLLAKQPESAVVNVTSIVVYMPSKRLPGYSASKAALHAYTQLLRISLAPTSIKVFELMPPLVNTEFSKEIGGAINGIPPAEVATALIDAMRADTFEVHVGKTADAYAVFRESPEKALALRNN